MTQVVMLTPDLVMPGDLVLSHPSTHPDFVYYTALVLSKVVDHLRVKSDHIEIFEVTLLVNYSDGRVGMIETLLFYDDDKLCTVPVEGR